MASALAGATAVTGATEFANAFGSQKAAENIVNSALVGAESLEQDLNNKATSSAFQTGKSIQF